jgi:hypothetical protein
MSFAWKKTALGALAALTLGVAIVPPAAAQNYGPPRGGPGGPPPGGWRSPPPGGWRGPPGGYNNGGISPGGAAALGVLGGLAIGAAAASAANGPRYEDPGPDYVTECWYERRIITDEYGDVIGRRRVRVCN